MSFKSIILKLASKECYCSIKKQDHMSYFIRSDPGSILGKANRKSRGKKETFRARFGPPRIPFLSITRLILGHRCSFWMSDAGRCFPLNPLSLPQSVYSCFPFGLHLKFSLAARPKVFFPPHTKGHLSIISSLFYKEYIRSWGNLYTHDRCVSLLGHLQEIFY